VVAPISLLLLIFVISTVVLAWKLRQATSESNGAVAADVDDGDVELKKGLNHVETQH
jgi:hypothetical protein